MRGVKKRTCIGVLLLCLAFVLSIAGGNIFKASRQSAVPAEAEETELDVIEQDIEDDAVTEQDEEAVEVDDESVSSEEDETVIEDEEDMDNEEPAQDDEDAQDEEDDTDFDEETEEDDEVLDDGSVSDGDSEIEEEVIEDDVLEEADAVSILNEEDGEYIMALDAGDDSSEVDDSPYISDSPYDVEDIPLTPPMTGGFGVWFIYSLGVLLLGACGFMALKQRKA